MADFVNKHGIAVKAVGIEVDSAREAHNIAVENGAKSIVAPTILTDYTSYKEVEVSEVLFYGNVSIRFVSGLYDGEFLPLYETVNGRKWNYGINHIDHVVGNVHNLQEAVNYVKKVIGLHEFAEFTTEEVGTLDSGLNSVALASNNEYVITPINEPTHGTKRKSQIQTYLEQNKGPGV